MKTHATRHSQRLARLLTWIAVSFVITVPAASQIPTMVTLGRNVEKTSSDIYFVGLGKGRPKEVLMVFNNCSNSQCSISGPAKGSGGLESQSGTYLLTTGTSVATLTLQNAAAGTWSVSQPNPVSFDFYLNGRTFLAGDLQLSSFVQPPGNANGQANQAKGVNLTALRGTDAGFYSAEALAKNQTVGVGGRVDLSFTFPNDSKGMPRNIQSLLGTSNAIFGVFMSGADAEGCPDTDGDGLCDDWETGGMMVNGKFIDLPSMGAHPDHMDIFVQEDSMQQDAVWRTFPVPPPPGLKPFQILTPGHSHRTGVEAEEVMVHAFANSPIMNPDNKTGIDLHADCGWDCVMKPKGANQACDTKQVQLGGRTYCTWGKSAAQPIYSQANIRLLHNACIGDTERGGNRLFYVFRRGLLENPATCQSDFLDGPPPFFDAIKAARFLPTGRSAAFHYGIFAHRLGGELQTGPQSMGGISRGVLASDFIAVALLVANSVPLWAQVGVPMHELGHNLGLRHGGPDSINFKPNYLSIMNYSFSNRGLLVRGAQGTFDYSSFGDLDNLNENQLVEGNGINGGNALVQQALQAGAYGTAYFCPNAMKISLQPTGWNALDWNCNRRIDAAPVASLINMVGVNGQLGALAGNYNDWEHLVVVGGSIADLVRPRALPARVFAAEITLADDSQLVTLYGVATALTSVVAGSLPGGFPPPQVSTEYSVFSSLPGQLNYLNFQIRNSGTQDDVYDLTWTSDQSWANFNGLPTSLALPASTSARFTVPVQVPSNAQLDDSSTVVLTALSQTHDAVEDITRAQVVVGMADLAITAYPLTTVVEVGQNLTYNVVIKNQGPEAASGFVFDSLPETVGFVSATPSTGQCQFDSPNDQTDFSLLPRTLACDVGKLAIGASALIQVVVTPSAPGPLSNVFAAGSDLPDPQTGDDLATTIVQVQP